MCWNDFIERNVSSYTIWLCISTSNIVKPRKGINYFPLLANFQNKQFMTLTTDPLSSWFFGLAILDQVVSRLGFS
jgi:hypothetical protein